MGDRLAQAPLSREFLDELADELDLEALTGNESLTLPLIAQYAERWRPRDWMRLSKRSSVTLDNAEPGYPWRWDLILERSERDIEVDVEMDSLRGFLDAVVGERALPRNPELEATLAADIDDPVGYLVYADWLEERGDPQASFIRLMCAADGERERQREVAE